MTQRPSSPIDLLLGLLFGLFQALFGGILGAFGIAARRAVEPIDLRRAQPDEVIDLRWRVLRDGRPRETAIFDGDDRKATRHWVAVQADRVVGVVSVMAAEIPGAGVEPPPRWQLRGMAVEPSLQGSGVGRALLEAVHAEVSDPMWCNARAHVEGFYARAGWRRVGEPFDIPGVGPHVRMVWSPS